MSDRVTEQEKPPQEGATDTHRESVIAQTLVREIFQSLIKHGRTTRLYGAGHQHTQGFLKSFVDGLESFLKHQDLLFVEIEPDQIIFQGKEVLSSTSHGELLIYGLYSEGARAIGVDREAPRSELEGLADLLSQDWHQRSELEDDLVAAFNTFDEMLNGDFIFPTYYSNVTSMTNYFNFEQGDCGDCAPDVSCRANSVPLLCPGRHKTTCSSSSTHPHSDHAHYDDSTFPIGWLPRKPAI